ncbi:dTMP kinase [Bdellovibrionota bacterium FG-1]
MKGILIAFEGTEGAGKSTLIHAVGAQLKRLRGSRNVVITREPGGTPVAEKIRTIILEHSMDPWTELFLYEAARAEHLAHTIRPAIQAGKIVLCDRFTDSTLAYQAFARGLPWKEVHALNQTATRGISPHLTVLLDIDPAVGLKRAKVRTRFEAEGVEFQKKVRRGFLKARRENPDRWLTLSAMSGTPEQLAEKVLKCLEGKKWLKNR